jgi:diadenylate cyclase
MGNDWRAVLSRIDLPDMLDILLIAVIFYHVLLLVKGTRGWHITVGILSLVVFYYVARLLQLRTLEWLLANFSTYIIFALIVIFQSEIRRALAELGRGNVFGRFRKRRRRGAFEEIVLASTTLSNRKIGGLIVLEGTFGLKNYIENGIEVEAAVTYDLLVTIFTPGTPLHDGAVIVQSERIAAASCFLPLTLDPHLSSEFGTRHRAAIGITQETDAIAVVISEETGIISAVYDGVMTRNLDGSSLLEYLHATDQKQRKGVLTGRIAPSDSPRRQEI